MKHMHTFKMPTVAVAIVIGLGLTASIPLVVAKPVKVPECEVLSPSFPTIQSAVDDANCVSIHVPKGTFNENVVINYRVVTIRGHGQGKSVVDGSTSGPVFTVFWSTVTLKGMTITGGRNSSVPWPNGGGITSAYSTLKVNDCLITGNEALGQGGGIQSVFGTLAVEDSTIINNKAMNGGGIRAAGGTNVLIVTGSVIADNVAIDRGGGIWSHNDTPGGTAVSVTLKDSIITGNLAGLGGGIYGSNSKLTVEDSTIADNTPDDIPFN